MSRIYMQKYGKFMETRFHELEHESKVLLKTHSHTSERREYEAGKERKEKRQRKEAYPYGTGKTSKKITVISPERGVGRECVDSKAEIRSSATTLARGARRKRPGARTDADAKVPKAKLCSTERAPEKSSQLAPVPPVTSRTASLWTLSSYIWIYPPKCPARILAGAFRYHDASPVPTPTTMATCRSNCERG